MTKFVLVSDFDGTMTANDFYKLAAERLLPPEALAPWRDYREGALTHFGALKAIFACIRASEEQMMALVDDMAPDPLLAKAVADLRAAGWDVVVASAGCDWYIRRVLARAGVQVEVHANPCTHASGGPLVMEAPKDSPFYCPATGVDKAAIVRFHRDNAQAVAFAGDGYADLEAALLVPPALRFARADLAQALSMQGEAYKTFSTWSDVARALLAGGAA